MTAQRAWFVTGTDTGVGKTHVACALLAALAARGVGALGMKPVASGCRQTGDGLRSADAEALVAHGACPVDYSAVNPYAFAAATAPHLAARAVGVDIRLETIASCYRRLSQAADAVVVEGIGGWMVPLGPDVTMVDLVRRLELPVILVVAVRLGCLNHALLTSQAVAAAGLCLAGWVANTLDAGDLAADYVPALAERLRAPLLGQLPRQPCPDAGAAARFLDIDVILSGPVG